MAKVFFDANYFVDIVETRQKFTPEDFAEHELHISPLSVHILTYLYKYKIPSPKLDAALNFYNLISFDEKTAKAATLGPTSDFEDNVQLHSAVNENCDLFLTNDEKLLKMTFFGKMKIQSSL